MLTVAMNLMFGCCSLEHRNYVYISRRLGLESGAINRGKSGILPHTFKLIRVDHRLSPEARLACTECNGVLTYILHRLKGSG